MCKNACNYDVEILSILTAYVYISDNRIIFCLMMSKGPWGDRGCWVPGVSYFVLLAIWPSSRWVCSPKGRVCSVNHMECINSELLLCGDGEGGLMGEWQLSTYICEVMSSSGVVVGVHGTWCAAWDGVCALPLVSLCINGCGTGWCSTGTTLFISL